MVYQRILSETSYWPPGGSFMEVYLDSYLFATLEYKTLLHSVYIQSPRFQDYD